jgi:tripartite ATP-independent transporter DctM subunit
MTIALIAAAWLALMLIGVPVGVAMIFVSMGYFLYAGMGLTFAVQRVVDGLNSFPLLAIPLFILAAAILNAAGIADRLFGFAHALVGHIRGGLGQVNVLGSLFFSGMSGSAIADAGGLGALEIKAMRAAGYDDDYSGPVTAASSMIGPLVPPSIPMVLYGVIANTSIGALFLGGVVPGFLCAISLMVMCYVLALRKNYPVSRRATLREIGTTFFYSFGALLTPFVIIGGIFSGWFSPTEAAAVTVAYALLLDLVFYRQLTWRKLWDALYETMKTSAAIGMIIAGVSMLGYILAREQAPQKIAELFLSMTDSPLGFLIAVNVMIFVLGMFIESLAILLIVVPMLVPVAMGYHIDPVHFGVVVVFNLMISTLTPPMGIALFVVAKVGNIPFQLLARAIIPWLIPPVIVLVLLTAFPPLVTWLPNLMMK